MLLSDEFEETLAAARAGHGSALGELYREIHPRVFRYLRALEPSEAEDLASDVWLDLSGTLRGSRATSGAFAPSPSPSRGDG